MIVIVDYGVGNLASVKNMFKRASIEGVTISAKENDILKADKIILPGVGSFDTAMQSLKATGLIPVLNHKVKEEKTKVLGICLGMQMLAKGSEEGGLPGLGWIDATVVKFRPEAEQKLKVPHMGWNSIVVKKDSELIQTEPNQRFYFVHSYYLKCNNISDELASCKFGIEFTCAVEHGNIYGTQFHPEKSLKYGMKVLSNFAKV